MMYNQGDIILVPFPYSDLTAIKRRPVLVVSNNQYNNKGEDIIVCSITSNIEHIPYTVKISDDSLEYGILPVESKIRVDKLFTVSRNKIIKKFSILKSDVFEEVVNNIYNILK